MSAEKRTEVQLIAKRFFILFIPLLLVLSIVFFLFYRVESDNSEELMKKEDVAGIDHIVAVMDIEFRLVFSDLLFLSEQNELRTLLDTDQTINRQALASEYLSFLVRKQTYDQIRFIDETGMEVVRVDFNYGNPAIVPRQQLQSKAKRYYFEDTFRLAQEEVFVSPMDLNIEHGEIEQPPKQMLRFGTPIFDADGRKRGTVILNYLAQNITHYIELAEGDHDQIMLLNSDGFWLRSPDPEDEWGFMYPDKAALTFGNDFPEAWQAIASDESGQFFNTDGLFTFATIYPLLEGQKSSTGSSLAFESSAQQTGAKEYYWKLVSFVPSSALSAMTSPILNRILLMFALMVVIVAGGSWAGARAIVRRKRAEEDLQKTKDQLEVRVAERTNDLRITNRQLSKSEASLDRAQHIAHLGSWDWDIIGNTLQWSDEIYRIFGLKPQEFGATYDAFLESVHPDDRALVQESVNQALYQNKLYDVEHRVVLADGSIRVVQEHGNVTFNDNGEPTRMVGAVQDITVRKQAEENIRRAAKEWSTTFDSIASLVSIHDKDFKLVRVNKTFADFFKMKPQELIGRYCYQVLHGANQPMPLCPHKQALADGKPHRAEFFEPYLGIYLEITVSPIFDEQGEIISTVHITEDITERKKMEEQLIVTDRLASIGELSSGIAHELNNPLTSVIGFSELLLNRDVPDDIKEDLEVINREAKRTAGVVRNLLTFARRHHSEKRPVDIDHIIQGVLELRAYEQKVSNIIVDVRSAPDLPQIIADGFQLQQVFLNIIINAEHFMKETYRGGTLTITTERVGNSIRISFADDGPGITEENLMHLFDPFFTTKEVGKGTGLGLSICHGIITEHGGRIYAESELGKGATFIVELPMPTEGSESNEKS